MRLTPEAVDWPVSFGSVAAATVAAAGAVWKFRVWLQDRNLQAQIESAAHFKEKGLEPCRWSSAASGWTGSTSGV